MNTIFSLLVLFQIKHFFADYLLQNRYMLGKNASGWAFLGPLFAHASVHAYGTFAIAAAFVNAGLALLLAFLDLMLHAGIDRLKASPRYFGRYTTEQPQFWWALGADQTLHHLSHYLWIWVILEAI